MGVGNYLGQNYGRIVQIEENSIKLRKLFRMPPEIGWNEWQRLICKRGQLMLEKKILIPVRWALAPMLVCTGAAAWAASVQAVSGSQQGGGEVVRIELSEPLKDAVTGFAIQSPARIALIYPVPRTPWGSLWWSCSRATWIR